MSGGRDQEKPARAGDCRDCEAACCRYVAAEIDRPTGKRDYDNIRWFLLHRDVHVFVDADGKWFLEFETRCEWLETDHRCRHYRRRPRICREHGTGDEPCVFLAAGKPHRHRFSTPRQFERFLERRGIEWRWRKPPPAPRRK